MLLAGWTDRSEWLWTVDGNRLELIAGAGFSMLVA